MRLPHERVTSHGSYTSHGYVMSFEIPCVEKSFPQRNSASYTFPSVSGSITIASCHMHVYAFHRFTCIYCTIALPLVRMILFMIASYVSTVLNMYSISAALKSTVTMHGKP